MGLSSSKQEQKSNNAVQNTYGYETPPETADFTKLREQQFEVDPGLAAQYGRQRADLNKSFAQPLGGYLSPQVRDAQMRSGQERLGRDEADAMRGGQFDKNKLDFARNTTVAGLTAPTMVQRGSTSQGSGTVTQTPSAMSTATGVAGALAPLSL